MEVINYSSVNCSSNIPSTVSRESYYRVEDLGFRVASMVWKFLGFGV